MMFSQSGDGGEEFPAVAPVRISLGRGITAFDDDGGEELPAMASVKASPELRGSAADDGGEELPDLLLPAASDDEEEQCVTPKSMLPAAQLVCPPPPRKPRPEKRKLGAAPPNKGYYAVPRDLSSVFVALPRCSTNKRIRAG